MSRLYLMRHGENRANITNEFSCRLVDYPLTPKGRLQAEQAAEYLPGCGIRRLYCSPLRRAVETAEIIAPRLGVNPVVLEELREINVGLLEGQTGHESWAAHNRVVMDWMNGHPESRFPGGEDHYGLAARMRSAVQRMVSEADGHNILAIGHGGIFTFTLRALCPDVELDWLLRAPNGNCSISELVLDSSGGCLSGKLLKWGETGHLHGAAAELVAGVPEA